MNFWQPSGGCRFAAIPQGAPSLFKTHYSHGNRIVGGGFLSGWASLPMSRAWEFFGPDNGCANLAQMRTRIHHYRRAGDDGRTDPEIGLPGTSPGHLLLTHADSFNATDESFNATDEDQAPATAPGEVFGAPRLAPVRVGQAAFKALVQEAYGRRCAVTGDKIVPVLQAAHIRTVTDHGGNRVDNGLLLRSDIHTLFDRGYPGVRPDRKTLLVSPRLRTPGDGRPAGVLRPKTY